MLIRLLSKLFGKRDTVRSSYLPLLGTYFPTADHVLSRIGIGHMSGRELRSMLDDDGYPMNGPEFYHYMAILEDKGLVRGWYEEKVVDGMTIKQRTFERVAT